MSARTADSRQLDFAGVFRASKKEATLPAAMAAVPAVLRSDLPSKKRTGVGDCPAAGPLRQPTPRPAPRPATAATPTAQDTAGSPRGYCPGPPRASPLRKCSPARQVRTPCTRLRPTVPKPPVIACRRSLGAKPDSNTTAQGLRPCRDQLAVQPIQILAPVAASRLTNRRSRGQHRSRIVVVIDAHPPGRDTGLLSWTSTTRRREV